MDETAVTLTFAEARFGEAEARGDILTTLGTIHPHSFRDQSYRSTSRMPTVPLFNVGPSFSSRL